MYFILSVVFMLLVIISLIFYKYVEEMLVPVFLNSKHTIKFRRRLSNAIYLMMVEIRNDFWGHLETLCEPDGDEPFEPFVDSPLRTCPPTEFVLTPPKEEIQSDTNNNGENIVIPPRRRGRRRIQLPPPQVPADVLRVRINAPDGNPNLPNPLVLLNMHPPRRVLPQNLRVLALQQQANDEQVNERRLAPPRNDVQEMAEVFSPPPAPPQNDNNNNPIERVFQFD